MESVLRLCDDTVEHASSASDFNASRSILLMRLVFTVLRYSQAVVHPAQVSDAVAVEVDEDGRGCAVDTDIGRVELGQLCTIMWEYEEYGEPQQVEGGQFMARLCPLVDRHACK